MEEPKYFLLDIDGVLTDGKFLYSSEGKLMKSFGAHDNDGLKIIRDKLEISFITSDKKGFDISKKRIQDMGFELEYADELNKFGLVQKKFDFKKLIYMADGFYDIKILKSCFYSIAPNNALTQTKEICNYVTQRNGGDGAVFEACLHIYDKFL